MTDLPIQKDTPDSGYSTLEVTPQSLYPPPPTAAYFSTLEAVPEPTQQGGGDTAKEVVPHAAAAAAAAGQSPPTRGRRILGLSLRNFVIAATVLVLVIIGAVVGGVVGSRNAKNTSNNDASGSNTGSGNSTSTNSTTATNQHVLAASHIAASNYTDFNGFLHRNVVFQDHTASLIVRLWDSDNDTWTTANLTERLPDASVLAGTALGIASLDFLSIGIHVYCQLQDNSLHAYGWFGEDQSAADAWQEEVIANTSAHAIRPATSLALAWQRPTPNYAAEDNVGYWIAIYQTKVGGLSAANYSGSFESIVDANVVAAPTGMALLPLTASDGTLSTLALLVESNGKVVNYTFSDGAWSASPAATAVFNDVPTTDDEPLQLAMTQLADGQQSLSVALMPNGTLQGLWDKGASRVSGNMTLDGGPDDVNFTAISMTFNGMFYGISGDAVYEYTVNTTDATTLTYVSTVFP